MDDNIRKGKKEKMNGYYGKVVTFYLKQYDI